MKHTNFTFLAGLMLVLFLIPSCTKESKTISLTILHTNDTHSQVEPLEKNNRGGYARRMGYINQEREQDADLLLFDAGDFWQGTPYFNFFNGRVEIDAMNRMGYDAATLGNHEFDNGVDTLAKVLQLAQFPIVCANYNVEGSVLEGLVKDYVILNRKGLKIGVTGVGCNPGSLITVQNFKPLVWEDPVPVVNRIAKHLREDKHCDLVVLLSHVGTDVEHGDPGPLCDRYMAANSRNIDIIIGGHTHRVVENEYVTNLDGKEVLLCQTGKSGINIGKIQLEVQ